MSWTRGERSYARGGNLRGSQDDINYGYARKRTAYAKKVVAARKSARGSVAAEVRKQLRASKVEKHYIAVNGAQTVDSALTGADAYFLLNAIAKGDDNYQRDGDSIALREIDVKGNVMITSNSTTQNVFLYVTVFVLACKSAPQATSANLPWTSFLDINGAYIQWTGIGTDRLTPMNGDDFLCLARKDMKISVSAEYITNVIAAGGSSTNEYFTDFQIKVPFADKHIQYDAGTNNPSTFNPFVCFAITSGDANGNAVSSSTIKTSFVSKVTFVDDN